MSNSPVGQIVPAVFTAAGLLQAEANEVGVLHVAESDLRRALRHGLQAQFGAVVKPERPFVLQNWKPRLGPFDVAVLHADLMKPRLLTEAKWCREAKLFESLWDLLKLALAVRELGAEGAYLVVGASTSSWQSDPHAALFSPQTWTTRQLLTQFEKGWGWLLKGNKTARPTQLPAEIKTSETACIPIHLAHEEDWLLKAVAVRPVGDTWLPFGPDGKPLPMDPTEAEGP